MKRRFFLRSTGGLIAALGYNQLFPTSSWNQYGKVLAQPTRRKLALLVGINSYRDAPLFGCVTDVELQRELLIHRFGFNPSDILTVTDLDATRNGILQAFEQHLIAQAKPGDVVVFHYSGHGSRVMDTDRDFGDGLNGTFLPVDSRYSREKRKTVVNDITGHTLFLLMSALKTDNVTAVLDSCFSGAGKRGTVRIRSVPRFVSAEPTFPGQIEREYQAQLLQKLNLSDAEFIQKRREGVAKGIVIASANRNQEAADANFDGFQAGAFTYFMTRYLWQQTGSTPVVDAIANISRRTTQSHDQDPELECLPQCQWSDPDQRPFYFLSSDTPSSDGVITQVSGKEVKCWLGGLENDNPLDKDSLLSVLDKQGHAQATLRVTQRRGLIATAMIESGKASAVQTGALIQEEVRGFPKALSLKIALDPALGSSTTTAKQELNNLQRIEAVSTEEAADYVLAPLQADDIAIANTPEANTIPIGAIGLFSTGKDRLLPQSFGRAQEPIEGTIRRLKPTLTGLLINRVLGAMANGNTSKLQVSASVGIQNGETSAQAGSRGSTHSPWTVKNPFESGNVKIGQNLEIKVQNQESKDLYISVLALGTEGELTVLHPTDFSSASDASLVGSQQTLAVPKAGRDDYEFVLQGPPGPVEILVLASVSSLRNTLQGLQKVAKRSQHTRGYPLAVDTPTSILDNLLADTTAGTRASIGVRKTKQQLVDNEHLAAIKIPLQVIQ